MDTPIFFGSLVIRAAVQSGMNPLGDQDVDKWTRMQGARHPLFDGGRSRAAPIRLSQMRRMVRLLALAASFAVGSCSAAMDREQLDLCRRVLPALHPAG